jgi:hypothetical protein
VLVVIDVINVVAAYQPVVRVCCTRWRKELKEHDIDHVINDKHNRTTIVVLAKYEIAP